MTNEFNAASSGRRGGIPGFVSIFAGLVFAGVVAVFAMVGNTFWQAHKALNMPEEKVQQLATQIVDPSVSAQTLEQEGFYKFKFGGFYLDDCRKKVLTDSFNQSLTVGAKADKINACILENIVETSAAANRGYRRSY